MEEDTALDHSNRAVCHKIDYDSSHSGSGKDTGDLSPIDLVTDRHPPESEYNIDSTSDGLMQDKRKYRPVKDKDCTVCGDKALGYNFNAVTCESCKAFFRRNAFKVIRGRCEGRCEVTVESRSYCKKCRLRKCFEVGMKKELILNDRQKEQRRIKIHENRRRRHGLPSAPAPADVGLNSCQKLDDSPSLPDIKIDPEFSTHQFANQISDDNLLDLSENGQHMVAELTKAFKISFDGPNPNPPSGIQMPSNSDFLNMADASVRRLVKMAKHLDAFRTVDQESQISLLKGSVLEVLILRSSKMFDPEGMGWSVNKSGSCHSISATNLQFGSKESLMFFMSYKQFVISLMVCTKQDNIIMMILIVLTVLSPDRAKGRCREAIDHAQLTYAMLLQEYIETRYPMCRCMFAKVMQKLTDIRQLNDVHTRMLDACKLEDLEPLVKEMFDLTA